MPSIPQVNIGRIVDPFANLQQAGKSLSGFGDRLNSRQDARRKTLGDALSAQAEVQDKATIRDTIAGVKAGLDTEFQTNANAQYERQAELSPQYTAGLAELDTQYADAKKQLAAERLDAEAETSPGYTADGNVLPFAETSQGKWYADKQLAFDNKYKDYRTQIDNSQDLLNRTTQGVYESGYSPTKVDRQVQDALTTKGFSQEVSQQQGKLAATPYQAAPITDIQRLAIEAGLERQGEAQKARYARAGKLSEGNLKIISLGNSGSVGRGGSITTRGGSKIPYEDTVKQHDQLMSSIDNTGSPLPGHGDNKNAIDAFNSYSNKYPSLPKQYITNVLLANTDDGIFWKTFKTDEASKKRLDSDMADMATQIGGIANTATTGRAGISNKDYNTLTSGIDARGKKEIADILSQYGGNVNRTTGIDNIGARVDDYNQLVRSLDTTSESIDNKSKGTSTPGNSKTKPGLFTGTTGIGKAINSSEKGLLAKSLSTKKGVENFTKEYDGMTKPQQKSIDKVLANKTSQAILEKNGFGIETTPGTTEKTLAEGLKNTPTKKPSTYVDNPNYGKAGNKARKSLHDLFNSTTETKSDSKVISEQADKLNKLLGTFKPLEEISTTKNVPFSSARTKTTTQESKTLSNYMDELGLTESQVKAIASNSKINYKIRKKIAEILKTQ